MDVLTNFLHLIVYTFVILLAVTIGVRNGVDYYFERKKDFMRQLGMTMCKEESRG